MSWKSSQRVRKPANPMEIQPMRIGNPANKLENWPPPWKSSHREYLGNLPHFRSFFDILARFSDLYVFWIFFWNILVFWLIFSGFSIFWLFSRISRHFCSFSWIFRYSYFGSFTLKSRIEAK